MANRFLNPQDFAAIKDLLLVAKAVVEGFLAGHNKSIIKGSGIEFSQYRSYQPGDDLRQLDWKMLARTDRYYIREAEADSNVTVKFVLDASGSMAHRDGNLTKLEYACYLVAALSYLAIQQGDAVGLLTLQEENSTLLQPQSSNQHLQRLCYHLEQLQPHGKFPLADSLSAVFPKRRQKEIVVFISDMYQKESEIRDVLYKMGAGGKDTLLFHLVGRNELNFLYDTQAIFKDLESGQVIESGSANLKGAYLEKFEAWLKELEFYSLKKGIQYHRFNLHEPLHSALGYFLRKRTRN